MSRRAKFILEICLALCCQCLAAHLHAKSHAILVGCSKYVHYPTESLPGAANDAEAMRRLLIDRFAFDEQDIVCLIGWPDEVSRRPSRANICAAFDDLVSVVQAGDQVVVYFSGHGSSRRREHADSSEPDGYDETFVPADERKAGQVLLDDQVSEWLKAIVAKGAHVWAIFDSCHSGTMTRGGVARRLTFDGIYDDPLSDSVESEGSLVAFYAAQEYEEAKEVVRPIGADETDEKNRHGLLSYHIEQALRQPAENLTYADLGRIVKNRYLADGRRRPIPFFDGRLEREVLGKKEWPDERSLIVQRRGDGIVLSSGLLNEITLGTIVAVYAPHDKKCASPIAHLSANRVSNGAAELVPIRFSGTDVEDAATIPESTHCRVVSSQLGDARLQLHVDLMPGSPVELREKVQTTLDELQASPDAPIKVTGTGDADWHLVAVTKESAATFFGIQCDSPIAVLCRSDRLLAFEGTDAELRSFQHAGYYSLSDSKTLASNLRHDFDKIHRWQNVWRIAGAYGEGGVLNSRPSVALEVETKHGMSPQRLTAGDSVSLRLINTSYSRYWYTLLYLDETFAIKHVETRSIERREAGADSRTHNLLKFTVSDLLKDTNGFVVIATEIDDEIGRPDYKSLSQTALGQSRTRASGHLPPPKTPFEELLYGTISGGPRFRAPISLENPQLASWAWKTVAE